MVRSCELLAALDGMDARGVGHVLLDDLADAEGGVEALRGRAASPTALSTATPALSGESLI